MGDRRKTCAAITSARPSSRPKVGRPAHYNLRQMKRLLEEFALISARRIRELPQARMRIRAFFIITALLAFPLQASSASTAASPPLPPPPRPAEAPSHPAPNDLALAEQTKRAPTIDQACLDRLSAAGIEFEQVTLPPAVNPECAIATPVRLKAVKLPPRWRTSIRLPEEPTLSCQFGERCRHAGCQTLTARI